MRSICFILLLGLSLFVKAQTFGTLDPSFGSNGKVVSNFPHNCLVTGMAITPGDTIIVGGTWQHTGGMFVTRYLPNGAADMNFGTNGMAIFSPGNNDTTSEIFGIALQADGKILGAGHFVNGFNDDFLLIRLNADGTADNSFGSNGMVVTPVNSERVSAAYSISLQSDGKILLAGYSYNSANNTDIALVRYTTGGIPDNTFGTNGIVLTDINGNYDFGNSIAIQNDSKIVIAGITYAINKNDQIITCRYNTNGSLDNTFNGTGKRIITLSTDSNDAYAVAIQHNQEIIVAGNTAVHYLNLRDFAGMELKTNGTPDSAFSTNGFIVKDIAGDNDGCDAIKILPSEKIIMGGYSFQDASSSYNFTLLGLNSDGSPCSSFGNSGITTTSFLSTRENDNLMALGVQSTGKIIAAGTTVGTLGVSTTIQVALARYMGDSLITGVKNPLANEAGLSIYPNPASNKISLTGVDFTTGKNVVNICDLQGRIIYQNENQQTNTITLPACSQVMYIVTVNRNGIDLLKKKLVVE